MNGAVRQGANLWPAWAIERVTSTWNEYALTVEHHAGEYARYEWAVRLVEGDLFVACGPAATLEAAQGFAIEEARAHRAWHREATPYPAQPPGSARSWTARSWTPRKVEGP